MVRALHKRWFAVGGGQWRNLYNEALMSDKGILALILASFVALGTIYALTTPVFEASDELWHYPMVQHLADGNSLPVQVFDPAQAGPWKQEASQPPLYYYVGAALTFWIDSGDMETVRRLNPHVDNGVVTADGNINLVVHDPTLSPWQGTVLAVRIVRLASVIMAAVTVYLTYRIAREVAPRRPEIALGAAALNAFTPMFLFISGAVNNDNLAIMLASLALFMMLRIVRRSRRMTASTAPGVREWLLLGVVVGLAALTKEGTLGLVPLVWGTALVATWQRLKSAPVSVGHGRLGTAGRLLGSVVARSLGLFALALIPALLIAGWWYYRNVVLYGDWLGWNAFIAVLGQRPQAATLAQLWDERWGFLASYWGLFGGVNVPMPDWIYTVLNTLLLLAVPGFIVYAWRAVYSWWNLQKIGVSQSESKFVRDWPGLLLDFVGAHFALVVCLLFSAAVIIGLISWATSTWSSQGRLAFTAISTLSTLLALGLFGWLPRRAARATAGALGGSLFVVAALAPILWIAPAYEPRPASPAAPLQTVDVTFDEKMHLTGFAVAANGEATGDVQPGDSLDVYLQWRVLESMARDWSVFVHLNDPVLETPLAQRDMYPGGGLLATSFLEAGDELLEHYRLHLPETAPAPAQLQLVVGLYDFQTNERLQSKQGEAAVLHTVALQRVTGDQAMATDINFGNEFALVDFEIEPRRLGAGGNIELALHWQALGQLAENYTFFAQVLNNEDTTRWAASDVEVETSQWTPGETQVVHMPLMVDEQTPSGVYSVIVGAYTRGTGGSFDRVQIVRDGRITMEDVLQLTQIRID